MHPIGIDVRTLPTDLHAEVLQMRVDAFTAAGQIDWPEDEQPNYVDPDRRLGAFDDDRLVGHAGVWQFGQWLGGARVAMGGVAAVITKPEARGSGVGEAMMPAVLHAQAEWGDAISCLYPTAPSFYRRFGYAVAGVRLDRTIRTDALSVLPRPSEPPEIRAFQFEADLAQVMVLLDGDARNHHGWIARGERRHRNVLEPDDGVRAWVARRGEEVVGYLQIERERPNAGDRSMRRQHVADLAASDRDTWLALWRLVGSESSVVQFTNYLTAPHDPLMDELSVPPHDVEHHDHQWMARLVDVRAAVEQRGWPDGADVAVAIEVQDPILRHNAGTFHLMVSRGEGRLIPARRSQGTVQLGIGALSALYTGHVRATSLVAQARLRGGTEADVAALDTAFASPQPSMHDYF